MADHSSNLILDAALQYAGRGWRVLPLHGIVNGACTCKARAACPTPGKHPSIKTGRAFAGASKDPSQIHQWFKNANRNLGVATGNGFLVIDVDGPQGLATLHGIVDRLPKTLMAASGRPDGGIHLWFSCETLPAPTNSGGGLDCRGDGGLVVVPPSRHISGQSYKWLNEIPLAPVPDALYSFLSQRKGGRKSEKGGSFSGRPEYLQRSKRGRIAELATAGMHDPPTDADLEALAAALPNDDCGWDEWNRVGMAAYAATDGSDSGLEFFKLWSRKSKKFNEDDVVSRWTAYNNSPPTELSLGTLIYEAREAQPGFQLPSRASSSLPLSPETPQISTGNGGSQTPNAGPAVNLPPHHNAGLEQNSLNLLNELNKTHFVVMVSNKAAVVDWVTSPIDPAVVIPRPQTPNSFMTYYGNQYVVTRNGTKQTRHELGRYWLHWSERRTYKAMVLEPAKPHEFDGQINLWRGFAVTPSPGKWPLMKAHIFNILGGGDPLHAEYIVKWAAWTVQNPGKRAEAALVFRGGEGVGKGVFGNTLCRIFGAHGLAIRSDKHLTGNFNAHLRSCLLLFSDEAFWPGHKAAEGVIKGLITEPTLSIEAKGFDLVDWPNRLHVVMSTNNDWVVPAARDARRYAVFDVINQQQNDEAYFNPLFEELNNGGREAMLHDLLIFDLKGWHPRKIIKTAALQEQKELSLDPLHGWWLEILETLCLPEGQQPDGRYLATALYNIAKADEPFWRVSKKAFGRFLKVMGATPSRTNQTRFWILPNPHHARKTWEKAFGTWKWPE